MSFLLRRVDLGKAAAERRDDLAGLVDRQRRLRDVGDPRVGRKLERLRVLDRLDEDRRLGRLAHRPDDLLVAGVADQRDRVPVRRVPARLDVHLGHERAGARRSCSARAPWRSRSTDGATPCAEKTTVSPSGTSRSSSTKIAPRASRSRTTWRCGRSACGRRPAARAGRGAAPPCRPRARPRRNSRAETPGERASPRRQCSSLTVPKRGKPAARGSVRRASQIAHRGLRGQVRTTAVRIAQWRDGIPLHCRL